MNYMPEMLKTYAATIFKVTHIKNEKGERLTIALLIPELQIIDERSTIFLNDKKKAQVPLSIWARNLAEQLKLETPKPSQHIKYLIATGELKETDVENLTTKEHIDFLMGCEGKEIQIHFSKREVAGTTYTDLNPYPYTQETQETQDEFIELKK